MSRTYAEITTLVLQMLQENTTTPVVYVAAETERWIEESLKELATYDPHIVDIIFKIESRTGTDTAGATDSLTDTTKSQFIATTDATDEKVVHNTTDNTWAVVTASTLTVLTLSNDIFDSGDSYKIYNKRCKNEKQIYIGDVVDYLWVDSVEYPLGSRRNFKVYGEVLEIDIDTVEDSNSTLDPPNDVDVLVRFAKPHKLCQLIDLVGTCSAIELTGVTEIALAGLGSTEIIEIGDELHIADQRTLYTVTTGDTTAAGTATIDIFPGVESATAIGDGVTFVKSTLKPQHEEIFCHLVAARAVLSDNIRHINEIPIGGSDVWSRYQTWGERKLGEVLGKLDRLSPPRTKRVYPKE